MLPSAANELYIADGWSNNLGSAPVFSTELRKRTDETTFIPLGGQTVAMTSQQWNSWGAGGNDEDYIIACVLTNMGLTAA